MRKLYGWPVILVLLSGLVALVYYRLAIWDGNYTFSLLTPFDLKIYALAGEDLTNGGDLYDAPYLRGFPFTYPPFAGIAFEALAGLTDTQLVYFWQGGTFVALFLVVFMVLRERGLRFGPIAFLVAALIAAATPANEATRGTFFYGQVNVLLMLLVSLDMLPRKFRLPGIGTGLAAGMKLTPAYMGLVLLFQKRWLAALGAFLTFVVTVIVGFVWVPDAKVFWTDAMFNSSRVGDHTNTGAKSLRSLLVRTWDIDGGWQWLLAVLAIFILTCLALRTAYKHGNRSMAMSITGLSACLVSPFSWYHHFVWTIPFGVCVLMAVNQGVGNRLQSWWGSALAGVASVAAFLAVEFPFVSTPFWSTMASSHLDQMDNSLQPFATWLWTGSCIVFITWYALWGFIARRPISDAEATSASFRGGWSSPAPKDEIADAAAVKHRAATSRLAQAD